MSNGAVQLGLCTYFSLMCFVVFQINHKLSINLMPEYQRGRGTKMYFKNNVPELLIYNLTLIFMGIAEYFQQY